MHIILANAAAVSRYCGEAAYANGKMHDVNAARVNKAVALVTNGRLPCYAIAGKRAAFKWVSVGSSCVISRKIAANWLARFGADIDRVESA